MKYQDYLNKLISLLETHLALTGDTVEIISEPIRKNNCLKTGIIIKEVCNSEEKKSEVSPTFYTATEEEFNNCKDPEGLIQNEFVKILKAYESGKSCKASIPVNLKEVIVPENIRLRVVANNESNREYLADVVKKEYLDMLVYCVCVLKIENDMGSITLKENLLTTMGLTADEAFEHAYRNTQDFRIRDMADVLKDIFANCEEGEQVLQDMREELETGEVRLHIVSNSSFVFGAIALYYPNAFKELSDKVESDLYILPSSVHECIAIAKTSGFTPEECVGMVKEVNANEVIPEERLTDSVYLYDRANNCITKIA